MKIDVKALAFAAALLWGGGILMTGLANLLWPTYGQAFLFAVASIYPGYDPVPSLGEVMVGTLYGVADGFVAGLLLAWVYNLLAVRA